MEAWSIFFNIFKLKNSTGLEHFKKKKKLFLWKNILFKCSTSD